MVTLKGRKDIEGLGSSVYGHERQTMEIQMEHWGM